MSTIGSHWSGFRTMLHPGRADEYRRVHARVPERLAQELTLAGVLSWRIWIDGETLFHAVETVDGLDAVVLAMTRSGYRDPEWDALIDTLVNVDEQSKAVLSLVWALDSGDQSIA